MEKNPPVYLTEIISGSSDKAESRKIAGWLKQGMIKKIAPRLYSSNLVDSPETIIKRNWFRVLAVQYPGSLISHRSALEGRPTAGGHIFLTYTYTKKINLPGMTIHFQLGHKPLEDDQPFFGQLYLSQQARAFLENLQVSKKQKEESKTLTREQIEQRLETVIKLRGEDGLNAIRDAARNIAPELDMEKEFEQFDKLIGALLATKPSKILSSQLAKARALGEPFDPVRVDLFQNLYEVISKKDYPVYPERNLSLKAYQNFAFFESYFSNYIEGTVFEIEEAREIILTDMPMPARNEDSHDVLGTYHITANKKEMSICPNTPDELLSILRRRHASLLSARKNKNPGGFKEINNRAGNTEFVDWTLVVGTLKKGFQWYQLLKQPFAKASYIMFLISEVHPFIDGNGRIARIMMNAELSAQNISKIMIPEVYREDYMGALRKLTRQNDAATYIRMMLKVFEFSSTVHNDDNIEMEKYLKECDAFMEPKLGKLKFNKDKNK